MEHFFDHERSRSISWRGSSTAKVHKLLGEVSRGHAESKDNLTRAAKSITRNIAEGSGRWKVADKVNFYHIARASATESAASLGELVDYAMPPAERVRRVKPMLSRIVAMLIGMIRSLETRDAPDMSR
jgi:four helix bundle protein